MSKALDLVISVHSSGRNWRCGERSDFNESFFADDAYHTDVFSGVADRARLASYIKLARKHPDASAARSWLAAFKWAKRCSSAVC